MTANEANTADNDFIYFDQGLIAFEDSKTFRLKKNYPGNPFHYLSAQEQENPSFFVVDPHIYLSDYHIPHADIAQYQVYCIISMQSSPVELTVNLLGPLLVDRNNNRGEQYILTSTSYSLHYPLLDLLKHK